MPYSFSARFGSGPRCIFDWAAEPSRSDLMVKRLSGFFPFLIACCANAQTTGADAPEKVNMVSVVLFLLLFVGTCVGYFAYVWWRERKKRQPEKGEKHR
jgi:hypothetical protein